MATDPGPTDSGAGQPVADGPAARGRTAAHGAGHVASAVVSVRPAEAAALAARIATLPQTEIHAVSGSRIVVVMEGPDARALADRLDAIAALPGTQAAALVFEQALEPMDAA